MCQAVWRSPLLPLQKQVRNAADESSTALGTGSRFKRDLLAYLREYGPKKTGRLVDQLRRYDFDSVRAALVASVPSKQKIGGLDPSKKTVWGWPGLQYVIGNVPLYSNENKTPHVVCQVRLFFAIYLTRPPPFCFTHACVNEKGIDVLRRLPRTSR